MYQNYSNENIRGKENAFSKNITFGGVVIGDDFGVTAFIEDISSFKLFKFNGSEIFPEKSSINWQSTAEK